MKGWCFPFAIDNIYFLGTRVSNYKGKWCEETWYVDNTIIACIIDNLLDAFLSFLAEQVQPDSIPECSGPRAGEAGV